MIRHNRAPSPARDTPQQSAPHPQSRLAQLLAAVAGVLVLNAAVWLVYARTIDGPFVWDDDSTIEGNESIKTLWPLLNSSGEPSPLQPSAFTPVSARPLVNLSFALNYYFGGLNPPGYRVVNIGIHLLASLLLWALVYGTLQLDFFAGRFARVAGPLSFAAALVWALHPLNTESVVYLTQRTESMMGLFYFGTLYAALRYWTATRPASRFLWLITATASCLLGALSKEMIVSVPAVALLYERTFIAGSFRRALKQSWPLYVGLALNWLVLGAINFHGPRTPNAGFHPELPTYIWWFTQAKVLLLYLKLSFWPSPLVTHYEIPYLETVRSAWPYVVPVAALLVATVVLVWRRTSVGFVAVCVVAVLSPTLVVPLVGEIVAERRMYVPLASIVTLVIVGAYVLIHKLVERFWPQANPRERRQGSFILTYVASTAAIVACGIVSFRHLSVFGDRLTLYEDAFAHQPDDFAILINYGVELARADRPAEAMKVFQHAADLHANSPSLNYKLALDPYKLYFNMGRAYEQLNQPPEAIEQYHEALRWEPNYPEAHYNLAWLYHRQGLLQAAIDEYQEAIRFKPDFAAAHTHLGALLASTDGPIEEAIPHFEKAARLNPDAAAYVNLVDAYLRADRQDEALAAAKTAVELARAAGQIEMAEQIEAWVATKRGDELQSK